MFNVSNTYRQTCALPHYRCSQKSENYKMEVLLAKKASMYDIVRNFKAEFHSITLITDDQRANIIQN